MPLAVEVAEVDSLRSERCYHKCLVQSGLSVHCETGLADLRPLSEYVTCGSIAFSEL